jgi:hypothetical protein
MRRLFRQTALDALSSPEQLENVLTITPLRPVIILAGLALAAVGLLLWAIFGSIPYTVDGYGILVQNPGYTRVTVLAPNDGEITEITISRDDKVAVGDVVARISLSDSSGVIDVTSLYAGIVSRVNVRRGDEVRANTALVSLRGELDSTSTEPPLEAILYLPYESVQMVRAGMTAYIVPSGVSTLSYGYMAGTVVAVGQFPSSDQFARAVSPTAPVVAVRIALMPDSGGFAWTLKHQPDVQLRAGMQLTGKILIREEHPLERVLRGLSNAR